jgi:hypothetical protein
MVPARQAGTILRSFEGSSDPDERGVHVRSYIQCVEAFICVGIQCTGRRPVHPVRACVRASSCDAKRRTDLLGRTSFHTVSTAELQELRRVLEAGGAGVVHSTRTHT